MLDVSGSAPIAPPRRQRDGVHARGAEIIERTCRALGTYHIEQVYEALFDSEAGAFCTKAELAAFLPTFSRQIDKRSVRVGEGRVLRWRMLSVYEYKGDKMAEHEGVDITRPRTVQESERTEAEAQ